MQVVFLLNRFYLPICYKLMYRLLYDSMRWICSLAQFFYAASHQNHL
ncbi:protein of unknown function [Xenorhabdus nematophila AN6/1]|nr:protein of unknown function [Xenorhabdus nematophila AN6/1]